jgi:NADPH:quinone reductase-like Zn-dependent oxidoreductase
MKAIVIGQQVGIEHLELVERPMPEPGPGDVVLRMRAASINYRDLTILLGTSRARFSLPLVPLSDGVGEVVAIGDKVTRFKPGERLAGTFAQGWLSGGNDTPYPTLGGPLDGMLAEYVRLPETGVVRVPAHLSDEEAASLPCAALTAWQALVTDGHLRAGDSVLLQGTGGVSIFALQFAVMSGARAIVMSSSDAKLERARALGAAGTINYTRTTLWHPEVRALTDGPGVDHVLEVGGPGTFAQSLQAIRFGGQINVIGYLGGLEGDINPLLILQRRAKVRAISVGPRDAFEAMNRAIALSRLRPVIDRVFPWTEAAAAFDHMRCGRHFGKIALKF